RFRRLEKLLAVTSIRSGGTAVTVTSPTAPGTLWSMSPLLRRSLSTAVTEAMARALLIAVAFRVASDTPQASSQDPDGARSEAGLAPERETQPARPHDQW